MDTQQPTYDPETDTPESWARDIFRGDWDAAGTTSVHLPRWAAAELLANLDWLEHPISGYWLAPSGTGRLYDIDEALQIALVATLVTEEAS